MAYRPASGDTLLVQAWFTLQAQAACVNQHFWVQSIVGGGVTQGDIAASVDTFWGTTYRAAMSVDWRYNGALVQKIWPAPRIPFAAATTNAGVGGIGSGAIPPQDAALIVFRTAIAAKGGRPRVYIPGVPASVMINNGVMSAGAVTAFTTFAAFLVGTYTVTVGGASTTYVVVQWTDRTKTVTPITGFKPISNRLATQRRRGGYGRPNTSPI